MPPSTSKLTREDTGPIATVHRVVDWRALNLKGWLRPFSIAASIVATVFGILIGTTWPSAAENYSHTVWLFVGLVLSLLSSALSTWALDASRRGQESGQIAAKVSAQEQLREAVIPSLRSVAKLSSLPSEARNEQMAKMVSQVLLARPVIFGDTHGVRMVIFRIKTVDSVKRLEVVDFSGRAVDQPSDFVSNDTGRGAKAFAWLENNPQTRLVPDLDQDPAHGWGGTGRGYKTFISAPIAAAGVPYGMLTVDAPEPGNLSETHIPILEVLAHVLANAFIIGPR